MKGKDIVFALGAALDAGAQGSPDARTRADALYELLAQVPWQASAGEPTAEQAFGLFVRHLEAVNRGALFDSAMLIGEVLAACTLSSRPHAAIISAWAARKRPGPQLAALRAWSKLCEHDTGMVDPTALQQLAERDDLEPPVVDYLGNVAGRLRAEEKGTALIELLGQQDAHRRMLAAHAITYSVSMDQPFATLSIFDKFPPSTLVSPPPSRRQLRLLASLLDDADPNVATQAAQASQVGIVAWPEMATVLADVLEATRGLAREPASKSSAHPPGVAVALGLPARLSQRYGALTWDPELVEEERADALAGTLLPRAIGAPRFFLSYRWSDRPQSDLEAYETAGLLHMLGYDIVFDRDPRHIAEGRSADDVLALLKGCSHFLGCVDDDLCRYFAAVERNPKTALDLEWELAEQLALRDPPLERLALWFSGAPFPVAAQGWPLIDLRTSKAPLREVFPECRFEIHTFDTNNELLHRSDAVDRQALRGAYAAEMARRNVARVAIHDVTTRPGGFVNL